MSVGDILCRLLGILQGSSQVNNAYNLRSASSGQVPQQSNPINVPSAAAPDTLGRTTLQILAANPNRKQLIIANFGTTVIAVKYLTGPNAAQGDWTFLLQASGVAGDGTGGLLIDEMWKGPVWVQSASGTGQVNLTELI